MENIINHENFNLDVEKLEKIIKNYLNDNINLDLKFNNENFVQSIINNYINDENIQFCKYSKKDNKYLILLKKYIFINIDLDYLLSFSIENAAFKFFNNCLDNNMNNLNKYIEQYDTPCIKKYKDIIKYLLNNENDIIDNINFIIYFYVFLNDLIENNDDYDILKNDEQFIDFCLYQKIKD